MRCRRWASPAKPTTFILRPSSSSCPSAALPCMRTRCPKPRRPRFRRACGSTTSKAAATRRSRSRRALADEPHRKHLAAPYARPVSGSKILLRQNSDPVLKPHDAHHASLALQPLQKFSDSRERLLDVLLQCCVGASDVSLPAPAEDASGNDDHVLQERCSANSSEESPVLSIDGNTKTRPSARSSPSRAL